MCRPVCVCFSSDVPLIPQATPTTTHSDTSSHRGQISLQPHDSLSHGEPGQVNAGLKEIVVMNELDFSRCDHLHKNLAGTLGNPNPLLPPLPLPRGQNINFNLNLNWIAQISTLNVIRPSWQPAIHSVFHLVLKFQWIT